MTKLLKTTATTKDNTVTATGLAALVILLVILAVITARTLVTGWILMLILGGLHHSVDDSVPAYGYWASVLIMFAVSFLIGLFTPTKSK